MFFLICENILTESNSILRNALKQNLIECKVSGSSSQHINGTRQLTKPEYAFDQIDKPYDWCSNCVHSMKEHPYIILSIKNRRIRLNGYFLKSGCCMHDGCCCMDEGTMWCECCLFSWSFQISNDGMIWKTVHKVERDHDMRHCCEKTFMLNETYYTQYVRLIHDESCPGDTNCLAINKIELIGTIENSDATLFKSVIDTEDEDVSIIGRIA